MSIRNNIKHILSRRETPYVIYIIVDIYIIGGPDRVAAISISLL